MKFSLVSFMLLISFTGFSKEGCHIESFPQIIFLQENAVCKRIVKKSNCHQKILKVFVEKVHQFNGNIPTELIAENLRERFNLKIKPVISPRSISVSHIEDIARKSIKLRKNLKFGKIEYVGNTCFRGVSKDFKVNITCKTCDGPGNANLQVESEVASGNGKVVNWLNAEIVKRIKVYRAKKNLNAYMSKLSKDDFEEVYIETKSPRLYLQEISHIPYYRLNRQLIGGDILKINSVSPVKLVHTGRKTKVYLKMKNMVVESSGTARQSGILGETIELINDKNKKKIIGKIIGFNKVQVEL